MTPAVVDARGQVLTIGVSAHVQEWSSEAPLRLPYLWTVSQRQGSWYVVARPTGETYPLTPALGQQLCLFQEPSFARPEDHAASWQQVLRLGWVMHAEQLGSKAEYLFQARRATPVLGACNTRQLVVNAASLHVPATSPAYRAGLLWRHLGRVIEQAEGGPTVPSPSGISTAGDWPAGSREQLLSKR